MALDLIATPIANYRRRAIEDQVKQRAAVSIALQPGDHAPHVLLIQRAEREGDPWSGQMALPGGRYQPGDADLAITAVRETREETGLDLDRHARLLGVLDDIPAAAGGRPLDLVITPFVYRLDAPAPELTIDPREVQTALWCPLVHLASPANRGTYRFERGPVAFDAPSIQYDQYTIWGLTYRILNQLLGIPGVGDVLPR